MKNSIIHLLACVVSSVALTSCSATANPKKLAMEPLHAVSITSSSIKISVTSNGCTKQGHFDFQVEPGAIAEVTVVRTKYDGCRRVPEQIQLKYALSALGLSDNKGIMIKNPIVAFKEQTLSKAPKD